MTTESNHRRAARLNLGEIVSCGVRVLLTPRRSVLVNFVEFWGGGGTSLKSSEADVRRFDEGET